MIIAIINHCNDTDRAMVARNLAVLRARGGRKVCLTSIASAHGSSDWCNERSISDIEPRIESRSTGRQAGKLGALRRRFNDIVIDAGSRNTEDCHAVLLAAKVVVVPVRSDDINPASQYVLIERINAARLFNPGLCVLFVMVSDLAMPSRADRAAVVAHVARLRCAELASTVLLTPTACDYGPGRCACDADTCDLEAAQQMRELCHEVYALAIASQSGAIVYPPSLARAFSAL